MTRRATAFATVLVLLCALCLPLMAAAQTDPPPPPATATLLVKLVDGLSAADQAAVIARNGGVELSTIAALQLHVIQVTTDQLAAILASYQADPQVLRAEENKTRRSETVPADALYATQWALPQIAWDQAFGTLSPTGSATVAVLDTGIDATHPDLAGNVVAGTSILDGSNGLTDPSGHGTWVAGIAAARTDPQSTDGIAGVGYAGVRVMPVTVLNAQGLGQDSDVIAGILWAVENGADVILMAFSNPGFSESLQEAIDYAWSRGVVLVAAVGNDAVTTPTFPAGDRGVVGVSATDPSDQIAAFSNDGQAVFLAAPGLNIETTDLGGAYTVISGTSASAAIVAGVAAFMKAMDPTLTNGIIVGRMARTADPAGTQDQTGNGRINMARALADTSIDPVEPAGAAPVGGGGPFVGPYVAAARNFTVTIVGPGSVKIDTTTGASPGTVTAATACGGTGAAAGSQTITSTCTVSLSVTNGATGTLTAIPISPATFSPGWSGASNLGALCTGTTSPCSFTQSTGNPSITATFTAGSPTQLAFGTQPSNTPAGSSITPAVTVRILDSGGNLTTSGATVAVAILNNAGPGGTLSGTTSLAAVNGVATFSTLSIDKAGTGYTLKATSTGLTDAPASSSFNITSGTAHHLTFTAQPTDTIANQPINDPTGIKVQVRDAFDNLVTSPSINVKLDIGTSPPGGSSALNGTTTVATASGVATFTGISIAKFGNGYTLTASKQGGPALPGGAATSASFNILGRSTTTGVACLPSSVAIGVATTCTATVTDTAGTGATGPKGTVSFSSSGTGTFSSAGSCTLPNSAANPHTCNVTYTPTSLGTGTHSINASYLPNNGTGGGTDNTWLASSSTTAFLLTVNKRTTSTVVSFNPGPSTVMIAQASTMMVTVTDTDAGTQTNPTGSFSLTSSSVTDLADTCTLVASGLNAATCTVKVWPQSGGNVHTITAPYPGDATHAISSGSLGLTVVNRRMCNLTKCN